MNPDKLVSELGALWSEHYGGAGTLKLLARANVALAESAEQELQDAANCVSIAHTPLYHDEQWVRIVLRMSQMTQKRPEYAFPLRLDGVSLIFNRITYPSAVFCENIDYYMHNNRIFFARNPFEDQRLPVLPVTAAGELQDKEMQLWGFRGRVDREYLYRTVGSRFGINWVTSEHYKDVLEALAACFTQGTTMRWLRRLLAALLPQVPVVIGPQETVQTLSEDRRGPFIATDLRVYRMSKHASPCVSEGQTVKSGDLLTNDFEIRRLDAPDALKGVDKLEIPPSMLPADVGGPIGFPNRFVPVLRGQGVDRCELEGEPHVIERFWGRVNHLARVHASKMKFNFVGAEVNPAKVLISSGLWHNCLLVVSEWPGLATYGAIIRRVLPPQTALLFA